MRRKRVQADEMTWEELLLRKEMAIAEARRLEGVMGRLSKRLHDAREKAVRDDSAITEAALLSIQHEEAEAALYSARREKEHLQTLVYHHSDRPRVRPPRWGT